MNSPSDWVSSDLWWETFFNKPTRSKDELETALKHIESWFHYIEQLPDNEIAFDFRVRALNRIDGVAFILEKAIRFGDLQPIHITVIKTVFDTSNNEKINLSTAPYIQI